MRVEVVFEREEVEEKRRKIKRGEKNERKGAAGISQLTLRGKKVEEERKRD